MVESVKKQLKQIQVLKYFKVVFFCVTTDSFEDLETETSEIIQETPLSG